MPDGKGTQTHPPSLCSCGGSLDCPKAGSSPDQPGESSRWSRVYGPFRHGTLKELRNQILEKWTESRILPSALQTIDRSVVRVYHLTGAL